jgi:hypothetical protein
VLSLSYLRTQCDESFSKIELYKNVGWKSGKKRPEGPVIDIYLRTGFIDSQIYNWVWPIKALEIRSLSNIIKKYARTIQAAKEIKFSFFIQ